MMTLEELNDNFADYADRIYRATAIGVGQSYNGQAAIHDTVRDVMVQLAGPQFGRNWGGMEASAKIAINAVLAESKPVKKASLAPAPEPIAETPKPKTKVK